MHKYLKFTYLNIYEQNDESSSERECALLAPQASVAGHGSDPGSTRENAVPSSSWDKAHVPWFLSSVPLSLAISAFIPNTWFSVLQIP